MNKKYSFSSFLIGLCTLFSVHAAPVALNQSDYIIVVNSVLRDATWENQLVALKEAQGLAVGILVVSDMDIYNPGVAYSQSQIRNLLSDAYFNGNRRLKYILLVGDANALSGFMLEKMGVTDARAKNYASAKCCNFIPGPTRLIQNVDCYDKTDPFAPTPPVGNANRTEVIDDQVENENGMISSDDFYGNFEGDLYVPFVYDPGFGELQPVIIPEAVVGRIPVRNISEMRNYVNKLSQYKSALTTTSATMLSFQKNVLGAMDDKTGNYMPKEYVRQPFTIDYPAALIPAGITLTNVSADSGQTPILFNNLTNYLFTVYGSGTGSVNELNPWLRYRTKYESNPLDPVYTHDRGGNPAANPPTADDDIDDYPAITNGNYTILISTICARVNFDGIDAATRNSINGIVSYNHYTDGCLSSGSDLESDILFTPSKGAIAYIGVRDNSVEFENEAFNKCFLTSAYRGEAVIGNLVRNAKQYCNNVFPGNRSRSIPGVRLGDVVLLGDPAMVINTPNQGATLANPATVTLTNNAGSIVATWSAVSGANGYSVSIGTSAGAPVWTFSTTATSFSTNCVTPGVALVDGQTYFVSVRPYKLQGTIPCFARNAGTENSVVADISTGYPLTFTPVANADGSIDLSTYIYRYFMAEFKGLKFYRMSRPGGTVLISAPYTTGFSFKDVAPPTGVSLKYTVSFLDISNNESAPELLGEIYATPQTGAGISFSSSSMKMGLIDGYGNLFTKGNISAGTGESGLRFTCPSNSAPVTLSAGTGNLQAAAGVTSGETEFLSMPGNLTGGLVIKDGTGRAVAFFAPNGSGQVKIYNDILWNTGW